MTTFEKAWDAVKGSDPRENWNNHPKYNTPDPCPRCNDTKQITETKTMMDGVPVVVISECPLCSKSGKWGQDPRSFQKAWEIVKAPRTLEDLTHYEAGRCPSCEGTGEQLVTVASGNTDESTSLPHARELAGKDASYHMMECVACDGTGKPDDEIWGDGGIMDEYDGEDEVV